MRKNQKRKKSENAESIDEANTTAAAAAALLVAVAVISRSLPSRRGCSAALALRAKKKGTIRIRKGKGKHDLRGGRREGGERRTANDVARWLPCGPP